MQYSLDNKSHRLLSVSDSSESKTAAPISRYVNVHTTSDNVRTFWRFIVQVTRIPHTLSLRFGISIWFALWLSKCSTLWVRTYTFARSPWGCLFGLGNFSIFLSFSSFRLQQINFESFWLVGIVEREFATQNWKINHEHGKAFIEHFALQSIKLLFGESLSNKWLFHGTKSSAIRCVVHRECQWPIQQLSVTRKQKNCGKN